MGCSERSSSSSSEESSDHKKRRKRKARRGKTKKRKDHKKKKEETVAQAETEVDQEDVERLLLSLLHLSLDIETELVEVFQQLDDWGVVYLNGLGDDRLRKKLRHLFRALGVGEVESAQGRGWRKLPESSKPLVKLVRRTCKKLRPQIHPVAGAQNQNECARTASLAAAGSEAALLETKQAEEAAEAALQRWREENAQSALASNRGPAEDDQKPSDGDGTGGAISASNAADSTLRREEWMLEAPAYLRCLQTKDGPDGKRRAILLQKKKDDEEASRVKAVMEQWNKARKQQTLREEWGQGQAEGQEAYNKWKRSMDAARAVWGKRTAEQANEQEFRDDVKKGQPWQRFNRERDLQGIPQVSQEDYQKLLKQNDLQSRFVS